MWVIDAVGYLLRGLDERALLAPCVLLVIAWSLWLRGPRAPTSLRTLCLLGGLVCGTLAIGGHLTLMVWWRAFHWLNPHTAYCASSLVGDLVIFISTTGGFLLSLVADGPGRVLALLAATMLVILRVPLW
jgi:hypothetical protein